MNKKHKILLSLADKAVDRLKQLEKPVVRLCGPLTSSAYGYDDNLRRFIKGQEILRGKGNVVFDYFEAHDDESAIRLLNLPWEEVMEYYHRPIMASGLIEEAYFLPRWELSNGAKLEHNYAEEHNIKIHDFPDNWFPEELQGSNLKLVQ